MALTTTESLYGGHACKLPPPPGGHVFQQTITIFEQSRAIIRTNDLTKFNELLSFKPNKDIIGTHFLNMFHGNQAINVTYNMALDGRKDGQKDNAKTISLRRWRGITRALSYT
ncbi:hypothetical protein DPMN_133817 [Dreissena polymorpha]|uniref:Uncharacterized protein n=1 Tax=Dreissena polymorpha TaxID=45954 RepID=A0A9D4FYN2_DREPO|nr:hypothetical protein DPMN_133817 [Dreissena polymorpha]